MFYIFKSPLKALAKLTKSESDHSAVVVGVPFTSSNCKSDTLRGAFEEALSSHAGFDDKVRSHIVEITSHLAIHVLLPFSELFIRTGVQLDSDDYKQKCKELKKELSRWQGCKQNVLGVFEATSK